MQGRSSIVALLMSLAIGASAATLRAQVAGAIGIHDPSSVIKDGSNYYLYGTGNGIYNKRSVDGITWTDEPTGVFPTTPAWVTNAVPGFTGTFWAPDIAYFNGKYHLYYSASTWGSIDSAIGVATATTLNRSSSSYGWTDLGKVVQSDAAGFTQPETDTTIYNAIDPSILVDSGTGRVWMSWGSYSSGIVISEIDPATGKRVNSTFTKVANNAAGGAWGSSIEGSSLVRQGSYYYLFVNYGGCCSGVDSTYNIRVGRSTSPTGPFVDKNGVDLRNGGGTLFLEDDGKLIGPGHFARFTDTADTFGYHYYNGDSNGAPTFARQNLYWTGDAWPSAYAVNPDWQGAASDAWAVAGNWYNAVVPDGVGHVANFGSRTATRTTIQLGAARTLGKVNFFGTSGFTISNTGQTLTLDAPSGAFASINANAGTHTIAAPINALDALSVNATSGARVNLSGSVTGTGLTKYGHGTLSLGATASFSQPILLRWGFTEITGAVTASAYTSAGPAAGEGGVLIVRGAGSFTTSADLNVGDTGSSSTAATGWLEIRDAATITVGATGGFFVGSGFSSNTRAVGTVTHDGGTLTVNGNFDGAFIVGGRTSTQTTGIYNLSGAGVVNANTNVRIGGRGAGTVNQTGGAFNASGWVSIGRFSSATGTWNLGAGTLNHTGITSSILIGESGSGTLTVSGTGAVATVSSLRLGHATGSTGVLNVDGGTVTAPSIARGTGSGTLNLNGGTIRASASTATFLQGLTAAHVRSGGARIDTQAFAITIAQPLLHDASLGTTPDGGLSKTGAGTLTLTGVSTYTGPTVLYSGTLALGNAARNPVLTLGGADLRGGTLAFNYTGGTTPAATVLSILNAGYGLPNQFSSGQIRATTLASGDTIGWLDNGTSSLSIAITLPGDADLDRVVDFDDLLRLASSYNSTGRVWSQGDFTYDGLANFDDLLLLAANYGQTWSGALDGSSVGLMTVVPEPALVMGALAIAGQVLRRRSTHV